MKSAFLISGAVGAILILTLALVGEPSRWPVPEAPPRQGEAATIDTSHPTHAPAALARLVREPQNTWTNLAFVFGGAFLISTGVARMARYGGAVLIFVGVGSFLYHASASQALRHLDVGAMYWLYLMTAPLCLSVMLPDWREVIENRSTAIMVATAVFAVAITAMRGVRVMHVAPLSLTVATVLISALVILTMARVAWRRESLSLALQFLGIVTLLGIAAMFQIGDRPGGWLYRPGAAIQGHAIWHVVAAITFVWSVRFLDRAAAVNSPRTNPRGAAATEDPNPDLQKDAESAEAYAQRFLRELCDLL